MKYLTILVIVMLIGFRVYSQGQYYFTGKVIDSSGALPLAGTTVSITGIISGKSATIQTDGKGLFKLAVLREDSFSIRFTRAGYETRSFFIDHPFNNGRTDHNLADIKLLPITRSLEM